MTVTRTEYMAISMARFLRDGDVLITGTNATIPRAAAFVANHLGRLSVRTVIGAFGTVNPTVYPTPQSGGDQRFFAGESNESLATIISDQVRGLADVICLGGLQLDQRGRLNLCVIGPYDAPTLRGPGTVGLSLMATVARTFVFFMHHDRRTFVQNVDFVGGEGLPKDGGGIELVVTPLAVFGPNESRDRIDLISIHPGVTFDEVQDRTGFRLDPRRAIVTQTPTPEELTALRANPDSKHLAELFVRT